MRYKDYVGTPLYNSWHGMKCRCNQASEYKYKSYIDVTYVKEWDSFEAFYNDMADSWFEGAELDKDILCSRLGIEPKIYSPETCMWVTRSQNADNTKQSIKLEYKGKKQSIARWSIELGINMYTLYNRAYKKGWSIDKILNTRFTKKNDKYFYKGGYFGLEYISKKEGISYSALIQRISKQGTLEKALQVKTQKETTEKFLYKGEYNTIKYYSDLYKINKRKLRYLVQTKGLTIKEALNKLLIQ